MNHHGKELYQGDVKSSSKKSKSIFASQSPIANTRANSLLKMMGMVHISDNDISVYNL